MIVTGVLAGPAMLDCYGSASGMGACLRGKVSDLGLLPERQGPVVAAPQITSEEEAMAMPEAKAAVPSPPALFTGPDGVAAEAPVVPAGPPANEVEVATVEPEPPRPHPPDITPLPVTPPTIDAIEIDGDANLFAGAGEEGAIVRLYVEDVFVAGTRVAEGHWLVEARNVLTRPEQRVRIDMLAPGTDKVVARGEVNFAADPPPAEASVAPQLPEIAPLAQAPFPTLPPTGDAAPANERPAPPVKPEPDVAAENGTWMPVPPDGTAPAKEAQPVPGVLVPRIVAPMPSGEPAPASEPVTPKRQEATEMIETGGAPTELRVLEAMPEVPQQAGTQGEPAAPAEDAIPELQVAEQAPVQPIPQLVEAEEQPRETSAISAMPPGDPGARRPALRKVVIRRGDTLWSIADRVYGSGYRYRTIYRANKDQIRNPRWIYPGQVLEIPLVLDEE